MEAVFFIVKVIFRFGIHSPEKRNLSVDCEKISLFLCE